MGEDFWCELVQDGSNELDFFALGTAGILRCSDHTNWKTQPLRPVLTSLNCKVNGPL